MSLRRIRVPAQYPHVLSFSLCVNVRPLLVWKATGRVSEVLVPDWHSSRCLLAFNWVVNAAHKKERPRFNLALSVSSECPLCFIKGIQEHLVGRGGAGVTFLSLHSDGLQLRVWQLTGLAPSYVSNLFNASQTRVVPEESLGRDVLACLRFRIKTTVIMCHAEHQARLRCDTTAYKAMVKCYCNCTQKISTDPFVILYVLFTFSSCSPDPLALNPFVQYHIIL